jgi:hypothetical protein
MLAAVQSCLLQAKSFLNILAFSNSSMNTGVNILILLPFCFSEMANAEHRY